MRLYENTFTNFYLQGFIHTALPSGNNILIVMNPNYLLEFLNPT